jgi:hypothetical protein
LESVTSKLWQWLDGTNALEKPISVFFGSRVGVSLPTHFVNCRLSRRS